MQVDLAHARLAGQGRLGDILLLIERGEQLCNTLLREKRSIFIHIGVKTRLAHQFILQIISGLILHAIPSSISSLTSNFKSSILNLQRFKCGNNMPAA